MCDKSQVFFFLFPLPSSIFGHEGQDADDVVYVNWLSMVRAGLLGLEFYTPESKSWRQVMLTLLPSITRSSHVHFSSKAWFCRAWCCVTRVYVKGQRADHFRCLPYKVTGLDLCLWGFYSAAYTKSGSVYMNFWKRIQCMSHECVPVCLSGSHAGSFRNPTCSAGGRGGPGEPGGGDGAGWKT